VGSGGFAAVWSAFDRKLQRRIAVKVLHPDVIATRSVLERFQREAQAVAKLRHPGVIPIFAVGEHEGLAFYTMPLIEGESLRERLTREGTLAPDEVRRILKEASAALAVAHQAGIVHRDIKPENLMLEGKDRRVVLMDFGIAKSTAGAQTGLTGTGMIIGTPAYMSPEQATGSKELDARSDVYSLGVVGFEMLTGKSPFTAQSAAELIMQHVITQAPSVASIRSDTPEDLTIAVNRCLEKEPGQRWKDAGELSAFLEGSAEPATGRVKASGDLRSYARGRRLPIGLKGAWVYAGSAVLIVVVAALLSPATFLGRYYWKTRPTLRSAADSGVEIGRAALNASPTLFPDSGYVTLQADQTLKDADGNAIPGFTRSIYFGPTSSSAGRLGTVATVLSVVRDRRGRPLFVRRSELEQESFARYRHFMASQGQGICFGNRAQFYGPLYVGGDLCIYSSGARFRSTVEATGTITGLSYATFDSGYVQRAAAIPMPAAAALTTLAKYTSQAGTSFTSPNGGTATQARVRIEFVPVDLDGDGKVTGSDEGFFRVYEEDGRAVPDYVTGTPPSRANTTRNCGDFHTVSGATTFYSAAYHLNSANGIPAGSITHSTDHASAATQSLQVANARCFLGGDEHLSIVNGHNSFVASDSLGHWRRYTSTPDAAVVAGLKNAASNAADTALAVRMLEAQYLWPLSRRFNARYDGVIYVTGRVVVSGVVRGRVTLAASDNIIIAGDLTYANPPGSTPCHNADMLGLLSEGSIYISDNVLNSPQPWGASNEYKSYKSHAAEYVQGALLSLNSFTVENYFRGPTSQEVCDSVRAGRGCLYYTGGLVQSTGGAIGTTAGTGFVGRYSYDQCLSQIQPPHYPTTGRFFRIGNYEVAPAGFELTSYFRTHAPQ